MFPLFYRPPEQGWPLLQSILLTISAATETCVIVWKTAACTTDLVSREPRFWQMESNCRNSIFVFIKRSVMFKITLYRWPFIISQLPSIPSEVTTTYETLLLPLLHQGRFELHYINYYFFKIFAPEKKNWNPRRTFCQERQYNIKRCEFPAISVRFCSMIMRRYTPQPTISTLVNLPRIINLYLNGRCVVLQHNAAD